MRVLALIPNKLLGFVAVLMLGAAASAVAVDAVFPAEFGGSDDLDELDDWWAQFDVATG